MCNLGWCYERGHGVPQDWKQAVEWYRRAAQAGNTVAMGNLGWCYEKGKGVEKDPAAAVSWYRQGAERGSVRSMYELGRCCQGGIGVAEDLKQALIWFHKSAEVGMPTPWGFWAGLMNTASGQNRITPGQSNITGVRQRRGMPPA